MPTLSQLYADFIVNTRYDDLEPEVIHQTKKLILDLIGVSLAGYELNQFPRLIVGYLASLGGSPEATIFQTKKRFPAVNAALSNSACAHALDMDDGHRFGALHPGAVIIPAAIAAAELSQARATDLIAGIVTGYEIMIRVGMAINPSSLNRGFHTTGIVGPFGSAAATAKVMRLSLKETIGALGLAGLQGSGLLVVNHDDEGARVKPLNPARAAMSGLFSSVMARKGVRGPLTILEGEDGFLKALTDKVDRDLLTRGLGEKFEICRSYIKLYAACRHAHACIDAALQAFNTSRIDTRQIDRILIETYPAAIRLAGITYPTTESAARFSIPFSVALALVKKDAGADAYCEKNIGDKTIQRLAGKVQLTVGSKWQRAYPGKRGAAVTIIDDNNRSWAAEVELAKGEPENPLGWEAVYDKFCRNATLVLSEKDTARLGDLVSNLERSSLDELMQLV